MNFFKLYIGDYLRDTGTLTLAQHGAYVLMLLEHYATEKPLPEGRELHRLLRADSKTERDAIDSVLAKFWTRTERGFVNDRAVKEFGRVAEISDTNREIALQREAKKRERRQHEHSTKRATGVPRNEHDESTSQTPDTRHQEEAHASSAGARPSSMALVGMALKRGGIDPMGFNTADPRLIALVEQGATPEEFEALAAEAIAKGVSRPYPWVLAVLPQRRAEASSIELAPRPVDPMAWRATADGVFAMGKELGTEPKPGETFPDFEARVVARFRRRSTQSQEAA